MSRITILFLSIFFVGNIIAQDKNFSQFYASPLTLNPALTGAFDGKYRIGINYRDQWRNVLDTPFKTFSTNLEVKFGLDQLLKLRYKDKVAVGLLFFSDKVGGVDFNTSQIALSLAYHKALDLKSKQYLSLGIQSGLNQRNVNYEDFTFDDQFNGIDGYTFPTGEELPSNNFSFTDLSIGLNYTISPNKRFSLFAGGALHHVFEPEQSFYNIDGNSNSLSSKLFRKISTQVSTRINLSNELAITPRILFALQGPHSEINVGTNVRISISEYSGSALYFGAWSRLAAFDQSGYNMDAIVGLVGFEYNGLVLGFSYDANIADLTRYQQGQGAFEISIAYLGEYESETILCPKF